MKMTTGDTSTMCSFWERFLAMALTGIFMRKNSGKVLQDSGKIFPLSYIFFTPILQKFSAILQNFSPRIKGFVKWILKEITMPFNFE